MDQQCIDGFQVDISPQMFSLIEDGEQGFGIILSLSASFFFNICDQISTSQVKIVHYEAGHNYAHIFKVKYNSRETRLVLYFRLGIIAMTVLS